MSRIVIHNHLPRTQAQDSGPAEDPSVTYRSLEAWKAAAQKRGLTIVQHGKDFYAKDPKYASNGYDGSWDADDRVGYLNAW